MTAVLSPTVTHYEELVPSGVEPADGALVEVSAGAWSAEFERDDDLPGQPTGTWFELDADGRRVRDADGRVKRMAWADVTFADGAPVYVTQFVPVELEVAA